jgi:hypothetical protein
LLVTRVPKHKLAGANHHGYLTNSNVKTIHQGLYIRIAFEVKVAVDNVRDRLSGYFPDRLANFRKRSSLCNGRKIDKSWGRYGPKPLWIMISPVEIMTCFVAFILTSLRSLGSPRQKCCNLLFTRRPETVCSS